MLTVLLLCCSVLLSTLVEVFWGKSSVGSPLGEVLLGKSSWGSTLVEVLLENPLGEVLLGSPLGEVLLGKSSWGSLWFCLVDVIRQGSVVCLQGKH